MDATLTDGLSARRMRGRRSPALAALVTTPVGAAAYNAAASLGGFDVGEDERLVDPGASPHPFRH
jgi:hypothetical protein